MSYITKGRHYLELYLTHAFSLERGRVCDLGYCPDTVQLYKSPRSQLLALRHHRFVMFSPQSKELTSGPRDSFVYGGSSHRRKSAACPKFDMVWPNLSPIPVGSRGVISSFRWFLPVFATRREGGRAKAQIFKIKTNEFWSESEKEEG